MTQPPSNSDDDYYVDEAFEEDSASEVEEEEEVEELCENKDKVLDVHSESESQSESDVEAEFLKGNVSEAKNYAQELIIKEFSLGSNAPTIPQPHARRQQLFGSGRVGAGFNRERMQAYPSSSSEDEGRVVVTETVAEVNKLALHMDHNTDDDDAPSVRTLVPKSMLTSQLKKQETRQELEEEDEEENDDDQDDQDAEDVVLSDADEDDSLVDQEELIEYDNLTDIEMGQLEEEEEEEAEIVEDEPVDYNRVTVVDASDSENSEATCVPEIQLENSSPREVINFEDNDTDITLTPRRAQKAKPVNLKPKPAVRKTLPQPRMSERRLPQPRIPPPRIPPPAFLMQSRNSILPMSQLNEFLSEEDEDDETMVSQHMDEIKADSAAVKFLEQQMAQMSEMILKTFRISGGDAGGDTMEQLNMASAMMDEHGIELTELPELPEDESEDDCSSSMAGEHFAANEAACDTDETISAQHMRSSLETLATVRTAKQQRAKCRCPTFADDSEPSFVMDECGQGDGLRLHLRHQHDHQHEISCRVSSVTPSSYTSDSAYHINLNRPRSSTDKVNYKNLGRKSFSFTNAQVREIERQNHILLKKMMTIKPTIKAASAVKSSTQIPKKMPPPSTRTTNAAVNRKKFQRQIDLDNDVLKRKLEAIGTRRPIFK